MPGLLQTMTPDAVRAAEKKQAEDRQRTPVLTSLASYIRECWSDAKTEKAEVEDILLRCKRQRSGEYDPDKLAKIREQGGSDLFLNLTAVKCRAAESWVRDTLLPAGDKPWSLRPTPIADVSRQVKEDVATEIVNEALMAGIPPQQIMANVAGLREETDKRIQEEAEERAADMERQIEDLLAEGGWHEAMAAIVDDVVTYPAAIMRGPIIRRRRRMKWADTPQGPVPQIEDDLVLEVERVSPFDVFPSPAATDIDDGYLIQRHRLTRSDISALLGVLGYDDDAIRGVLDDYGKGGLTDWLSQRETEDSDVRDDHGGKPDRPIDALEFWGSVQGKMLLEWGMDEAEVPDPLNEYEANVWLVGEWVIKAQINPDPLGRKPYYKASFDEVPGEWWGRGIPQLIEASQGVVNAAARSLVNNLAISSGPQVEVNVDRIPAGEDISSMYPWKIWQVTADKHGSSGSAVNFYQPNPMTGDLLTVLDRFYTLADDESGIPRYSYGDPDASGAATTATGLSMLMNAASKGIKQVISNLDHGIIAPLIERIHQHLMLHGDDPSIKGDMQVIARGAASLLIKEQQNARRLEFLQMTANPLDSQVIGPAQRAQILREVAGGLEMDVDKIVPDQAQIMAAMGQRQGPHELIEGPGPDAD